jgi:hypothetical protein
MRCSWRKTTAGESRCPASLDGAVGRLLVQEGRCDEALPLVRSDSSEAVGDDRQSGGWGGAEQRGGGAEQWEGGVEWWATS